MRKCKCCPPPPVTPGPSSYTPSRLYPDFWNNLRADHIPMHGAPPYDYPGPVPGPWAPAYAGPGFIPPPPDNVAVKPRLPENCLAEGMNAPPLINRKGRVLVRNSSTMPFKEPEPVAMTAADIVPAQEHAPMPTCPTPCPCPCPPPPPGGFNPPEESTSKVYRGTVTLLEAGKNVTLEEERQKGVIMYTVSSKDVETQEAVIQTQTVVAKTQVAVSENTQQIKEIEEKLPELEVSPLTEDDIDDILNLVGLED